METISKPDKINVDFFEESAVLSAAADLSPVSVHGEESRVDSMTFVVSASMLLKMHVIHAKMDVFMRNMGSGLLQTCGTCELQTRNISSENHMDTVSLETSPVHLAKYVSIIRSMKNALIFCAQPLARAFQQCIRGSFATAVFRALR